jgi:hypothetical protein
MERIIDDWIRAVLILDYSRHVHRKAELKLCQVDLKLIQDNTDRIRELVFVHLPVL